MKLLTAAFAFLTLLLIAVFLRSTDQNLFKRNAADALVNPQEVTLPLSILGSYKNEYTVVVIDNSPINVSPLVFIPFENLAGKETRNQLEKIGGDILLYAGDISQAARAWVILNQLGFGRVFILSEKEQPELLNYEFQPDTTAGLEF